MSIILKQGAVTVNQPDGSVSSLDVIVDQSREQAIADIEAKKDEVLASIPDDYSQLSESIVDIKKDCEKLYGVFTPDSTNLANTDNVFTGHAINSAGEIIENQSYSISDFIPVKSASLYTSNACVTISYYNAEKEFIKRINVANGVAFTSHDNAAYVRISANTSPTLWQINEGTELLEYEPYYNGHLKSEDVDLHVQALRDEFSQVVNLSGNLFDTASIRRGIDILADGSEVSDPSYITSSLIVVEGEAEYSAHRFVHAALYDVNNKFIQRVAADVGDTTAGYSVIHTTANTRKIRLSTNKLSFINDAFFVKGAGVASALRSSVKKSVLPALTKYDTSFYARGENLYNPYNITNGRVITTEGEVQDIAINNFITDEIQVVGGDRYKFVYFVYAAWYDKDRKFIKREYVTDDTRIKLITAPDNAEYLIAGSNYINSNYPVKQAIYHGNVSVDEDYKESLYVPEDTKREIAKYVRLTDKYMVDMPIPDHYQSNREYPAMDIRNITPAQIHELFTGLVSAAPDYVTKTNLGNDDFGNAIAYYTFTPPTVQSREATKQVTIMVACGTHGYEHMSMRSVYYSMLDIINNWRESAALELLRHNVKFIVNPCVNPSGWLAYTRMNGNGVDVNRNFPSRWKVQDKSSVTYGGDSPLSEKESQYIKKMLDDNPDISVTIDYHNYSSNPGDPLWWMPSANIGLAEHVGRNFIAKSNRDYNKRYAWYGSATGYTSVDGYTGQPKTWNQEGGQMKHFASDEYGQVLSTTLEQTGLIVQAQGQPDYEAIYNRFSVETFVNYCLHIVKALVD